MYSLYILKLKNGSYYVGSTSNLSERLKMHAAGQVKSTRNQRPPDLIYQESYPDRSAAQSREYQIKKWKSRSAIERLLKSK